MPALVIIHEDIVRMLFGIVKAARYVEAAREFLGKDGLSRFLIWLPEGHTSQGTQGLVYLLMSNLKVINGEYQ